VWLARAPAAESITAGREAEYLTPLYRDFSYNKIGISDSQLDGYLCSFRQPGAMHAGFMLYRDELRSADANKQFSRTPLTIPVLTVGGQYSLGDFSLAERQVALNVHGIIIPNAAHFLMSDNPQAVSSALADFFTP
jgi:pimeloyl-ACP methyl ester carboxylesterase